MIPRASARGEVISYYYHSNNSSIPIYRYNGINLTRKQFYLPEVFFVEILLICYNQVMISLDTQTMTHSTGEGKLHIQLKESDHSLELWQAEVVKNWTDKTSVSLNLPNFIAGLNKVGSFDLAGAEQVLVQKPDGTRVVDPRDDILVGRANETDTLEFLLSRIFQMDVKGMSLGKSDEGLVKLYSDYRGRLVEIMRTRHALKSDDLNNLKVTMREDSNKSQEDYLDLLRDWSYGEGPYFEGSTGFDAQQLEKDKETLPKVRALISNLSSGTPLSG